MVMAVFCRFFPFSEQAKSSVAPAQLPPDEGFASVKAERFVLFPTPTAATESSAESTRSCRYWGKSRSMGQSQLN